MDVLQWVWLALIGCGLLRVLGAVSSWVGHGCGQLSYGHVGGSCGCGQLFMSQVCHGCTPMGVAGPYRMWLAPSLAINVHSREQARRHISLDTPTLTKNIYYLV
jgi:hypothetical protein